MRTLLALALATLAGCVTVGDKDSASSSDRVTDKTDLVQSRAAAAVFVARVANQNSQPKVVEAELSVAAQYLPRPNVNDLKFAQSRADSANKSAYVEALEAADRHQRELGKLRQDAVAQVAAAKEEGENKIKVLKAEQESERQKLITVALLAVGSLGIIGGIAGLWLGFSKPNAASSILVGGVVVASVKFFDSPLFAWVAVPAMAALAFEAIRRLKSAK